MVAKVDRQNISSPVPGYLLPLAALTLAAVGPGLAPAAQAVEAQVVRQIPDEYESTSGHGVAMNNAGYAVNDGASAIRANPSLLANQKQYTVTAGYHWPASGRDYYQAAIVDSKTSPVAAGVSYTGFLDDYAYHREDQEASPYDSPLIRRGVLGVAQRYGNWSVGAGATYVEANPLWSRRLTQGGEEAKNVRGVGLNLGVSSQLTPELNVGASGENLSNRKIVDYAPRTLRAGLAYGFTKTVVGFLDYRQRERVAEFEAQETVDLDRPAGGADEGREGPEQLVIGSFTAQVQDFLRIVGSYAQALSDERRSLAGGAAVVNKNFSLSYTVSRPYMEQATTHQAVTLSLEMAM